MNKHPHTFNKLAIVILLSVSAISVDACSYKDKFEGSPNNHASRQREFQARTLGNISSAKLYGESIDGIDHHNNLTMALNEPTADAISDIPGVADSIVVTTNKNAYVAILMDNTAFGSTNKSFNESNIGGTNYGVYDAHSGSDYADPRMLATGNNSYITSQRPEDISGDLKQKIAEKVRLLNPYVLEVYISGNRDFINQMNVYAVNHVLGKPMDTNLKEFNEIVANHFASSANPYNHR